MGSNLGRVCRRAKGVGGGGERIRDYIHNHSDANEGCAPVRGRRLR